MGSFFEKIESKAAGNVRTIVLPEGDDERMLEAAVIVAKKKMAKPIILGTKEKVLSELGKLGASGEGIGIIDPEKSDKFREYADIFNQLRKSKGVTAEQAEQTIRDPMYFGTMMVKCGDADGLVAGAVHSSPDTIRPALQIIKPAEGFKTVSSIFFMCLGEQTYIFADCGLVEDPTISQLSDIAVSTAITAIQFGIKPRIAMLSYSTKGSARGEGALKIAKAAERAREKIQALWGCGGEVIVDGELQFDAAFVPDVAKKKCPDSPLKGRANVFIFPDLGAGNITYKAVQRLAGADAFGPILQGLNKPVNDLSRGCTAMDIVAAIAITAIQSQK